ncbi:FitA-like ribbon-helix-helix domain-containing protein [Nocardioides sp. AE5]|uniref:FitA-like ribbon-helix-helix domain-containing protein n=1 Tax=Nocardioides sp. AE5 TaxID=2962573 RepID=UPI0028814F62|nr:hypothetical protein [Nocardioides sp. AE5]MDT0203207.1 hypothetical protein [Nocardioides sp. AE5]
MATVLIRNLDDAAYAVLRERAAASGRSLQEYLRINLERMAVEPTVEGAIQPAKVDIPRQAALTMDDIVETQRAGRAR